MEALSGPGQFIDGRAAALDDARMSVETAGIGPGAEFGGDVDLALVPSEAAGPVAGGVGRGSKATSSPTESSNMSRPSSRARSSNGSSASDQLRVNK
jgi:hypothetical protein